MTIHPVGGCNMPFPSQRPVPNPCPLASFKRYKADNAIRTLHLLTAGSSDTMSFSSASTSDTNLGTRSTNSGGVSSCRSSKSTSRRPQLNRRGVHEGVDIGTSAPNSRARATCLRAESASCNLCRTHTCARSCEQLGSSSAPS